MIGVSNLEMIQDDWRWSPNDPKTEFQNYEQRVSLFPNCVLA